MTAFLEVEGLETSYGQSQVLFGIDLSVGEGEVLGVMGKNGMGKTTTVRSIMGLTRPQRGKVRVGGVEVQHLPADDVVKRESDRRVSSFSFRNPSTAKADRLIARACSAL